MTLDKLNQMAAIFCRDALDEAIENLEAHLKIKLTDVEDDAKDYFAKQRKEFRAAIDQLNGLRAVLHKRAFDAYKAENSQTTS